MSGRALELRRTAARSGRPVQRRKASIGHGQFERSTSRVPLELSGLRVVHGHEERESVDLWTSQGKRNLQLDNSTGCSLKTAVRDGCPLTAFPPGRPKDGPSVFAAYAR